MKPKLFGREHTKTPYIQIDTQKCEACWKCIEECPGQVIGKVEIFLHKHARINHADQCFGCLICIEGCESGAIRRRGG